MEFWLLEPILLPIIQQNQLLYWSFLDSCGCPLFFLLAAIQDEGAVFALFGIGRRWMTTLLTLILRFNSGDPGSLSSVMHTQDLQLNSLQPLVQTLESPPDEPPGEH